MSIVLIVLFPLCTSASSGSSAVRGFFHFLCPQHHSRRRTSGIQSRHAIIEITARK
jgi:hypothetical protein